MSLVDTQRFIAHVTACTSPYPWTLFFSFYLVSVSLCLPATPLSSAQLHSPGLCPILSACQSGLSHSTYWCFRPLLHCTYCQVVEVCFAMVPVFPCAIFFLVLLKFFSCLPSATDDRHHQFPFLSDTEKYSRYPKYQYCDLTIDFRV